MPTTETTFPCRYFETKGLRHLFLLAGCFLVCASLRADIMIRESIECLVDRSEVVAVYEIASLSGPSHEGWSDRYEATLTLVQNLRGPGMQRIKETFYLVARPCAFSPEVRRIGIGDQFVKFFVSGDPGDHDPNHYFMGGNSIYLNNKERDYNFGLAVTADFRILTSKELILSAIKNRITTGRQIGGSDRVDLLDLARSNKTPNRPPSKDFMMLQIPFSAEDWHYLAPTRDGIEFLLNMSGPDVLIIPSDLYFPYLKEIDRLYFPNLH